MISPPFEIILVYIWLYLTASTCDGSWTTARSAASLGASCSSSCYTHHHLLTSRSPASDHLTPGGGGAAPPGQEAGLLLLLLGEGVAGHGGGDLVAEATHVARKGPAGLLTCWPTWRPPPPRSPPSPPCSRSRWRWCRHPGCRSPAQARHTGAGCHRVPHNTNLTVQDVVTEEALPLVSGGVPGA